ncbi:epimerase [Marinomonas agarivorans]|nr:epimerase [Marinomonas agarivorans]
MKVLVLGGTGFLGGAITQAALTKGFDVDVVTRQSKRSENPKLTYLLGDRYDDLSSLNHSYDLIFDTCAYETNAIKAVLARINLESLERYVFISSTSAYQEYHVPKLSEEKEVNGASQQDLDLANSLPNSKKTSAYSYGSSYGPLKRECEIFLEKSLGNKAIMLRSGLLVGAGDYSDRLTWWVRRVDLAGNVVCPKPQDGNVQLIDVRDAAEFAVDAAISRCSGIYNLAGHQVSFGSLMNKILYKTANRATLKWVSLHAFTKHNLSPWTDVPLALPEVEALKNFFDISTEKAQKVGLKLRPIEETIQNILEWDRENRDRPLKCGYDLKTEQVIALEHYKKSANEQE